MTIVPKTPDPVMAGKGTERKEMEKEIIKTKWGDVKLVSSNLDELFINGFRIPLNKTSEYVDHIGIPSEGFIKRMIELRLEKEVLFSGEKEKISVGHHEESGGEQIVAFWKICFEVVKLKCNDLQRKQKTLVKLHFVSSERDIPFEIKESSVWITIGKKEVRVPVRVHPMIGSGLSITFNFFGYRLKGIYR